MKPKNVCAILLIIIYCLDIISARRRSKPKDKFCSTFKTPVKPWWNKQERVSIYKCMLYNWEMDTQEYLKAWNVRCDGDMGVINGVKAKESEFPHMGALGWWQHNRWKFYCGASLISPNFALTAAHCSYSPSMGEPIIIRLGATDITNITENVLDVRIERIIKHPKYSSPIKYYDITLLALNESVRFSKFIQPACLWTQNNLDDHQNNYTVTGWGTTKERTLRTSADLLVAHLDIINSTLCKDLLYADRHMKEGLKSHQICAGKLEGGSDTCQGDSGGPLQFEIKNARSNLTIHYVVGITSAGRGCGAKNSPGLYTKVASFIDWIEKIVWPEDYTSYELVESRYGREDSKWVW